MSDNSTPKKQARRGRPSTGGLVWRDGEWVARFTATLDGERVRVWRPLGTDSKQAAKRKLERLMASEQPSAAEAKRVETFEEAARAGVKRQAADGLATWKDRLHRLEAWAFPAFGHLAINAIRPPHVSEALEACQKNGKSRRTIMHLKIDISTVLDELWREEQIPENVARKVRVPKNARVDERRRVVLSDEEFDALMSSESLGAELATMAFTSRTFGGMRTSDLHAWDWKHVDTVNWSDAHVPRPKTKSGDRLGLPERFVPVLQQWWRNHGSPTVGPVFPVRRGPRAGERKQGKSSYAEHLREALWQAGIARPLEGFEQAALAWRAAVAELQQLQRLPAQIGTAETKAARAARLDAARERSEAAEAKARALCLIQAGSEDFKPLDFHSFRRAFATGLASSGMNVQQAMALAGHRNASTHMRYVRITEVLEVPASALPKHFTAPAVPKSLMAASRPRMFSAHPGRFELPTLGFVEGREASQRVDSRPNLNNHPGGGSGGSGLVQSLRQNSAPNCWLIRRAADAALGAYLSVLATGLADALLAAPGALGMPG